MSNLLDTVRIWLARGLVKAWAVPYFPQWSRDVFLTPTFRAICAEGVKANGIVFSCLSALVFPFPEPRLRVWQGEGGGREAVANHPATKLLDRPNPQMGQAELLQHTILYLAIGGNCYWYKVRSAAKRVVELWPLNDGQIRPIGGGDRLVSHYEWDTGEGQPVRIESSEIVHFKWMPDPLAPWRGLAPLVAVARDVDTDNEATKFCFSLLANDATPRTVMQVPGKIMTLAEADRLRAQFIDKYGGDKRGTVAILDNGATISRLSMNLQELAFESLRRVPEARIAGALRVPPVLAGLNVGLEMMTYSNLEGSRRYMTEDTLVPLWRMIGDEISTDLLPEFGKNEELSIAFDLSTVVALREDEDRRWTRANEALGRGAITVNQHHAIVGLPPDANGDVYLRSLTIQEVPAQLAGTGGQKALAAPVSLKAATTREQRRSLALTLIAAQRQQRDEVAKRMESALNGYFGGLADRVVGRALKGWEPVEHKAPGDPEAQPDDLPRQQPLPFAEDLLTEADAADLGDIIKRFALELVQLSWQGWNLNLGVEVAFDLHDPAVTAALADAGAHVQGIQETTLKALREALQYGSEQGWSIQHLVQGDRDLGKPGLRDLVERTYKGRAEAIARTELGTAQQVASGTRFLNAGIKKCLILDNGFTDSAEQCIAIGNGGRGSIVPIEWALAHPLGHPNCVRCSAAWLDDDPTDDNILAQWQAAGGDSGVIGGP